jgi:hypothetical protein
MELERFAEGWRWVVCLVSFDFMIVRSKNLKNSLNDLNFDEEENKLKSSGIPVFDSLFQGLGSKNIRGRVGRVGGGG